MITIKPITPLLSLAVGGNRSNPHTIISTGGTMKTFLTTLTLILLSVAVAMAGTLNINTANEAQLETLSRIGSTKAHAIVTYRDQHGSFKTVDDLTHVKGIGAKTVEMLRKDITVNDK